jgi:hypothetical protein
LRSVRWADIPLLSHGARLIQWLGNSVGNSYGALALILDRLLSGWTYPKSSADRVSARFLDRPATVKAQVSTERARVDSDW